MTTTVKHKGSVHKWEGPIENWDKHRDVIVAWCDGADVEFRDPKNGTMYGDKWQSSCPHPYWHEYLDYRIKQREPEAGEVWIEEEEGPCLITDEDTVVWLDGTLAMNNSWSNERVSSELKYSAPSVRAYFMREVMEQWEHEHKSLDSFTDWLKEQCEYD